MYDTVTHTVTPGGCVGNKERGGEGVNGVARGSRGRS